MPHHFKRGSQREYHFPILRSVHLRNSPWKSPSLPTVSGEVKPLYHYPQLGKAWDKPKGELSHSQPCLLGGERALKAGLVVVSSLAPASD